MVQAITNFFLQNFNFYENLTLQKFGTIQYHQEFITEKLLLTLGITLVERYMEPVKSIIWHRHADYLKAISMTGISSATTRKQSTIPLEPIIL